MLTVPFAMAAISAEHLVVPDTVDTAVLVDPSGNVGIGTLAPGYLLHVATGDTVAAQIETGSATNSTVALRVRATGLSGDTKAGLFTNSSGQGTAIRGYATDPGTINSTYGVWGQSAGPNGRGVLGLASSASGPSSAGIGGGSRNYGGFFESSGHQGCAVFGEASNMDGTDTYGGYFISDGRAGSGVYGAATNTGQPGVSTYGGYFESLGVDGIGVYAEGRLHGIESVGDVYVRNAGAGVSAVIDPDDSENGHTNDSTIRLFDDSGNLGIELHSDSADDNPAISLWASDFSGGLVETIKLIAADEEIPGIRAIPKLKLTSFSGSKSTTLSTATLDLLQGSTAAIALDGTDVASIVLKNTSGTSPADAVEIIATDDVTEPLNGGQVKLFDGNGVDTVEIDSNDGAGGGATVKLKDSAGNITIELDADYGGSGGPGRVITGQLEITGGCDLSEQFDIRTDGSLRPGMVVCIDPQRPGSLVVSSRAYDPTVAGIVSGAGGRRPGRSARSGSCRRSER